MYDLVCNTLSLIPYTVGKNQLSIRLVMYQVGTCKFHLICYNVSYYSETLQKHYRNITETLQHYIYLTSTLDTYR